MHRNLNFLGDEEHHLRLRTWKMLLARTFFYGNY